MNYLTLTQIPGNRMVAEGKTKMLFDLFFHGEPWGKVLVVSKDDITAGDGAKHDIMSGKARYANQTACNVFDLLNNCGIPTAFIGQVNQFPQDTPEEYKNSFVAWKCTMLPYEVVVRREAHGSFLKRSPHLKKGHIFPQLVLEFYLKTSGKKWKGHDLVCDDPLMIHDEKGIHLYDPKQPNFGNVVATPFLTLPETEVFSREDEKELIVEMGEIARETFLILEKAWQLLGRKLVDFKVEFGISSSDNKLLLSDVIDNDSWRVVDGTGSYMDKQVYRDGGNLDVVIEKYRQVAELTGLFNIPVQQILLWRGSEKDDFGLFTKPLGEVATCCYKVEHVTCSVHKQPALAYELLQKHLSEVPDTVVVSLVGMSNGAGPVLSANCTVPVITVPADYKNFPDDVWSSLRMPSNVPVMTVLSPSNAILAALQILAMRNPGIYAALRLEQEKRLTGI